ncbi:glycogen branching protein [Pseudomonas sp. WHRI 8822A]|uniref:hypothetical protein n=1 Tax=Pseudomonas sp. WHRI 8822A TaxID=3162568 RepID=UPI0032EDFD23
MPKIQITQAFNFQSGGVTKHYKKGEEDVPQAVADHAIARGYSPKPAEPDGDPAQPAAEPAAAKAAKKA